MSGYRVSSLEKLCQEIRSSRGYLELNHVGLAIHVDASVVGAPRTFQTPTPSSAKTWP